MAKNIKKSIVTRVRVAFLCICLFAAAIVAKVVRVQFFEGQKWAQIQKEKRIVYQPVYATRGDVLSDDGRIMATSLPFYRVAFDPTICPEKTFARDIDSLALLLSRFYQDKSPEGYRRKIKNARLSKRRYVRLHSRLINYQDKKMMTSWPIFREGKNKGGVIFEKVDKRFRPFGSLAQRTIGRITEDKNGSGLEYSFNSQLAGKDGEALFERMAGGNKPIYNGTEVKPMPGYDIRTTIDINLQDVAENALYKALVSNNAQYGCVVLMEVQTGEIKAIANLGKEREGVYVENYNYAVGNHGRTEPGSTFKLASMMALFEETDLTPDDSIDTGKGPQKIGGAYMNEATGNGYGMLTIADVFGKSSNPGTAKLIERTFGTNPQKYVEYLEKFGLTRPLGFQLHGEARPFIRTPQDPRWSRPTLSRMAIGYGLQISPLQTLAFYNAVANNGIRVTPIIVKEIRKADAVVERFEAKDYNPTRICSEETVKKLQRLMEGVVERGTGKHVKSKYYKVAGKTGTAWKVKDGKYDTKVYSTSFAGYFPADNPKYSCVIIIDTPKSGRIYGGDVAAPVFRELADKAFARSLSLHKPLAARINPNRSKLPPVKAGSQEELTLVCNKLGISTHALADEEWIRVDSQNHALIWKPNRLQAGRVPNVTGMTLRDALFVLGNQGIKVRSEGVGRVQAQSLEPGTPIQKGSVITLTLI
jgi:cell division protein FtsI (penicillin-binding protein 3)